MTDRLDRLTLNTFGAIINRCPDQTLLQEILQDLIPMQMGKKSLRKFCARMKQISKLFWRGKKSSLLKVSLDAVTTTVTGKHGI
ncbi:hypothetical protein [Desulfitobacterium sp. LBE]|uniref:hypothetical protein n=1 Tax=Desulfitobacterium sp. LBE TaxID=884086 RepID=UPI0011A19918|nr:hypothetical protein [Desulfitobacterium sp. LBE]